MIGKLLRKNNPTIALNILYVKEKEICPAYISKINSNCEKTNNSINVSKKEKEGWYYLAVRKVLCIITWNNFKT